MGSGENEGKEVEEVARVRLTPTEKQLGKELKAANVRLTTIYKESQKSGDFTVYNQIKEKLSSKEIQSSGLVHTTEKGVLQVKQAPSNYRSDVGKLVADIMRSVPTMTQLKKKFERRFKELRGKIKDWWNLLGARLKVEEEKQAAYDALYAYVEEQYTDAEKEELMRETYERAGSEYTADDLLQIVKEIEKEREDDWKTYTGGALPFTD